MRHDFSAMNRKKAASVAIVCLALIGLIFYGLGNRQGGQDAGKDAIKPEVTVYTVQRQDMLRRISLFGQTVSLAHIDLAPKYAGRISAVNVQLGNRVQAGDVLLVQDTKDLDLAIRQNVAAERQGEADTLQAQSIYQATYNQVTSDYNIKQQNYERYAALYEQGAISKESLDAVYQAMINSKSALDTQLNQAMSGDVPASVESKRALFEKTQGGTQALENQRSDLILRAPRDGIIGYRAAEVGAIAQAGQKVLELVDNSQMYVDCQLSEQDVAAVQAGLGVVVDIESLGKQYAGKIIYVSPSTSSSTKSYIVRIELSGVDDSLKEGMFGRTRIEVLQRPQTLFVPKESIVEKNGKTSLFIVDGDGKVTEHVVTVGLTNDAQVEILTGLAAGETVVASNLARLKDGVTVAVAGAAS